MSAAMDPMARLIAIDAIRQLKARYFRAMDTKQFDELRAVFARDATFDARQATVVAGPDTPLPDEPIHTGREAILAFIAAALTPVVSVHQGHTPEIEILSDTTARGIVPMADLILADRDGTPFRMHGFGHYHETYIFEEGAWRIATSVLTRLRIDFD